MKIKNNNHGWENFQSFLYWCNDVDRPSLVYLNLADLTLNSLRPSDAYMRQ